MVGGRYCSAFCSDVRVRRPGLGAQWCKRVARGTVERTNRDQPTALTAHVAASMTSSAHSHPHPSRAAFAAGGRVSGVPLHNLPPRPRSIVGRAQDLALARERLLSADVRLLTLTGPPGVGKTRLAVELGAD